MSHLATNIKLVRKLLGETQEEFIKHFTDGTGKPLVTIGMQKSYEGERATPNIIYLTQLSQLSGIAIEDLSKKPINIDEVKKDNMDNNDKKVTHALPGLKTKMPPTEHDGSADGANTVAELNAAYKRMAEISVKFSEALIAKDDEIRNLREKVQSVDKQLSDLRSLLSKWTVLLLENQESLLAHYNLPPAHLKDFDNPDTTSGISGSQQFLHREDL